MFFGQKLKKLRLEANIGLRNFTNKIDMKSSEYNDIENGYIQYPINSDWIWKVINVLNLDDKSYDKLDLLYLWHEPFIMQKMPENILVSPFTHTVDGELLNEKKYIELSKYVNKIAVKHNQKVDKYNASKKEK